MIRRETFRHEDDLLEAPPRRGSSSEAEKPSVAAASSETRNKRSRGQRVTQTEAAVRTQTQ